MKKVTLLAFALLLSLGMKAQEVQEITLQIGSITAPAYTVALVKTADVVQDAMKRKLKDANLKTKNSDGYLACFEQVVPEIAEGPITLFTKVEEQGKRKERTTLVTVCAVSSNLTIDQTALRLNTKRFLEDFVHYIDKFDALQKMEAQQEELKKAEKNLKSAQASMENLEKDIKSQEAKIADKKKEIAKYQDKIKSLEKEISSLESGIEKSNSKRAGIEQDINKANNARQAASDEVERYRQLTQ